MAGDTGTKRPVTAPPLPPEYHIHVVAYAAQAYRRVIDNMGRAVALAGVPFAITLPLVIAAMAVAGSGSLGPFFAGLLRAVSWLLFASVFVTRWYRFELLGERAGGRLFTRAWRGLLVAELKLAASLFAGAVVLELMAAFPPHFVTVPVALIGWVGLLVGALRTALVFPAAAIDRPISFGAAWDLLSGHHLRLVAGVVLCYLPFGIVQRILGRVGSATPWPGAVAIELVSLAVAFAGVAVLVSLTAGIYRGIFERPRVEIVWR